MIGRGVFSPLLALIAPKTISTKNTRPISPKKLKAGTMEIMIPSTIQNTKEVMCNPKDWRK